MSPRAHCGPRLSDYLTREEFDEMRLAGQSYADIGQELGFTKWTVAVFARQCGSPLRTRRDIMAAWTRMLHETGDGSEPAWVVASRIGCGYELVRKVRQDRGLKGAWYEDRADAYCPRCGVNFYEYPRQRDGNCILCWCEANGVNYRADLLETGLAVEMGLVAA